MELFPVKKDKSGNPICTFIYYSGIDLFSQGNKAVFFMDAVLNDSERQIAFVPHQKAVEPAYLPYCQITAADFTSSAKIIAESKNVAGRAVIGGLVLGPLGALVGGASGIGDKKKAIVSYYLVINYRPHGTDDEVKAIILEIVGRSARWDKFLRALKERIPKRPVSQYL